MSPDPRLHVYAQDEVGRYGWEEKPWYRPGERLDAFVRALEGRDLDVVFARAPPATDAELAAFHTADHIAQVVAACAADRGSVDDIAPAVLAEALALVRFVDRAGGDVAPGEVDVPVQCMPLETYRTYLTGQGLLEPDEDRIVLSGAAGAWLSDPNRRLDGPTLARAHLEPAARYVVGAALHAARAIVDGQVSTAFLPIGGYHHARPSEARMYCLYNDVALAITEILRRGQGTVAHVDIDVHFGDGVYEAFAAEPRVVLVDVHEDGSTLFPHSPESPGRGVFPGTHADSPRTLFLPLAPRTTNDDLLTRWERAETFLRSHRPDVVVFEAGVDALDGDPTSHQAITIDGLTSIARRVRAIADDHAQGRLLAFGGGGYDVATVATAWTAMVEAIAPG